jgi:hypothetical protein
MAENLPEIIGLTDAQRIELARKERATLLA